MKALKLAGLVFLVLFCTASTASAYVQKTYNAEGKAIGEKAAGPDSAVFSGAAVGAGLGAAFTLVGAGYGLGRIGSAALESMARQPEVAPRIMTAMIIIAAILEGATFFSLIVCILINGNAGW